jgi:hypothetical protein
MRRIDEEQLIEPLVGMTQEQLDEVARLIEALADMTPEQQRYVTRRAKELRRQKRKARKGYPDTEPDQDAAPGPPKAAPRKR